VLLVSGTSNFYDLRHAQRTTPTSAFTFRTLDGTTAYNSGAYVGLAASPAGIMHVVYYDVTAGDWRHQHRCP
jgi:hypothetical protein